MTEKYKLYLGDSKQVIDQMIEKNELVDMIITSPPYWDERKSYSGGEKADGEVGCVPVEEYVDWFLTFTEKFLKVLKPNGSFFLNINEKIVDGEVHPVIDELKYKMRLQGWKLVAKPYIWFKSQSMPHGCRYRAIDRYEYVFHFSNSTTPNFYADNCRIPHAAITIKRFEQGVTTLNSRDGVYERKMKELNPNGGLPINVVQCKAESNPQILHPAPFSVDLAEWFVKIGAQPGDIVLDPFNGSGSSGIASLKNGRKYIGIDLVDFNIDFTQKRFNHFESTGETYIPKGKLADYDIDVNYYKQKGKHVNNP